MYRAGIPMYDLAEVQWATDTLWQRLGQELTDLGISAIPETLDRRTELEAHWAAPNLLLSQMCGVEVVHRFAGRVTVLGTPRARRCTRLWSRWSVAQ